MFSWPWRKNKTDIIQSSEIDALKLEWLEELMPIENKLPRPQWELINQFLEENQSNQDQHKIWCKVARQWMDELEANLAHDYIRTETDNFILLSSGDHRYNKSLSLFLERCRKRLLSIAKGICDDKGFGKHVVIVFADIDSYYDYITYYGPKEGNYGLSSGMYLNYGYGHFVFQQEGLDMAEPIAAHEMTHALLAHLPIPAWLNEGMAVNMESMITGLPPEPLNKALFNLHQSFWNSDNIQEFWRGESFFRSDDGQKLSYQLAQILVTTLSKNYTTFTQFANQASCNDGGESAFKEIYGVSLGEIVANFLGEGDWSPDQSSWSKTDL